jgi:hypothetical protein
MTAKFDTREAWLRAAAIETGKLVAEVVPTVPTFHVSVGFPKGRHVRARVLVLLLALAGADASAGSLQTESQQTAHLKRAVDVFLPMVRACGPALIRRWELTTVPRSLKFSVDPRPEGATVAGTPLFGETIVLFPRFFDLPPEDAALVLVHEWLHTQGLGETDVRRRAVRGPNGLAPTDREINESILAVCR